MLQGREKVLSPRSDHESQAVHSKGQSYLVNGNNLWMEGIKCTTSRKHTLGPPSKEEICDPIFSPSSSPFPGTSTKGDSVQHREQESGMVENPGASMPDAKWSSSE